MKSKHSLIRKAVFPVAGMGTRFLPATKASPKEMLIVVNKPLIQYAVEEAYAAGIRQMIFVTCHNKSVIEDHFDKHYQFEDELISQNKQDLLSVVRAVSPEDMECFYVRQSKALGLGHAVLCAERLIGGDNFAVILADDLMISPVPVMKQMTEVYEEYGPNILAVEEVPANLARYYGIIQGESKSDKLINVKTIIEKPLFNLAPPNIAVVGRYILSSGIFDQIKALRKVAHDELQLTDAISGVLKKEPVLGYRFDGTRYDCGSIIGFLKANVDFGRAHSGLGSNFSKWLLKSFLDKKSD